jgi:hypothetical protein
MLLHWAMMGLGLSLAIEKVASGGTAPPIGAGNAFGMLLAITQ